MDFSDDKKSSHGLMTQVSVWAFGWVLANTGAKISTVSLFTPNFLKRWGSMGDFSEISLVQHPFEPLKNGIREFSWNHLDSYFAKNVCEMRLLLGMFLQLFASFVLFWEMRNNSSSAYGKTVPTAALLQIDEI